MPLPLTALTSRAVSFLYGLSLPLRAAALILRKPRLLTLSLLPVALTIALYLWLFTRIELALQQGLTAWALSHSLNLGSVWVHLAVGLTQLLLIIAIGLSFSLVAGLVAIPFNDFLAEATERYAEPPLPPVTDRRFRAVFRRITVDAAKTLVADAGLVVAFLTAWIPIVDIGSIALGALLLTFQFISYPQTRRDQGLNEGVRFLGRHFFASLGFGLALGALFSIPFLSFIMLPLAVVGGTLLVAQAPSLR